MAYFNGLRWLPCLGAFADLAAFIVTLKLLLVSVGDSHQMENAAIVTYNVSYIGQDPSHYPVGLADNVTALIPAGDASSASVTQYLGIADWYSLHYVSTCQGYFAVDPASGLLTSDKINITCTRQSLGYTFSLLDTVSSQLEPSVKGVISDIPSTLESQYTKPWVSLLLLGIILSGIEFILLALTIRGVWHLNMNSFIICFLAMVAFAVSSGLATGHARGVQNSGIGYDSNQFLAMTWAAVGLEALVLCLVQLEWKFELFTPRGQRITCYQKPPEVDTWLSMTKNRGKPKNHADTEHLDV